MTTTTKYNRNSHPYITEWLKFVSFLNYGRNEKKYKYKKESVIARYNSGKFGGLTKQDLISHEEGRSTLYYMAPHQIKQDEIIVIVDIDAHKQEQTSAAALLFAQYLSSLPILKGLYYEPSTNGKGFHCTVRIFKKDIGSHFVKGMLKHFERWLRLEAKRFNVDVEIKGTPSVVEYKDNGNVSSLTFGSLCRLPRDLKASLNTASIDKGKIFALNVSEPKVFQIYQGKKQERSTVYVTDEMLAAIPVMSGKFKNDELPTVKNDKHKIVAEDIAIFLLLAFCLKENKDNSLPVASFKGLWTALYNDGSINRSFNSSRFAAIRNWLSENGHIHWIDNTFSFDDKGQGFCCKWKIGNELNSFVNNAITHTHNFVLTKFPAKGNHAHLIPVWVGAGINKQEKERARLWRLCLEVDKVLMAA